MYAGESCRRSTEVRLSETFNPFKAAIVILAFVLGVALTILNQSATFAQDAKAKDWIPAEEVVPGDSMMFASISNIADTKERFKGTALYNIWMEPEVQDFLQPILKMITDGIQLGKLEEEMKKWAGLELDDVKSIFTGQVSAALIDFDQNQNPPLIEAALLVDIGDVQRFQQALSLFETKITEPDEAGKIRVSTYDEYEFEGIKIKTLSENDMAICYTLLKNTFVITIGRDTMESIVNNYKGKTQDSLSKNPSFVNAKSRVNPGGGDFLLYIKLSEILSRYGASLGAGMDQFVVGMGVDKIQALGVGISIQGKGIRDGFYASTSGDARGFITLFMPKPLNMETLDIVPQSVTTFGASRMNLPRLWKEINALNATIVNQVDPGAHARFQQRIADYEDRTGVKLDEFFNSFGGEIVLTYIPTPGGAMSFGLTDYVFIFTLKDGAAVERNFDKLAKDFVAQLSKTFGKQFGGGAQQGPPQWRESKYKDYTIKYVVLQGIPLLVTPAYVVTEKYLLVGLMPQALTATIDRIQTGGASVKSNADFKDVTSKLSQGYGAIFYMDLKKEFPRFYALARMAIPMLQSQIRLKGIDFTKLPQAETINQHLFGYAATLKTFRNEAGAPNGILLQSYSPIGNIGLVGGLSMMATIPALTRAREAAKETICKNNLKQIGVALLMYRQDNNQKLPAKLTDLTPQYIAAKAGYVCPLDAEPKQVAEGLATSYAYIRNPSTDVLPSKSIVAYDNQSRHRYGGRNVLFLDGHVQRMNEGRFQQALQEQQGEAAAEEENQE